MPVPPDTCCTTMCTEPYRVSARTGLPVYCQQSGGMVSMRPQTSALFLSCRTFLKSSANIVAPSTVGWLRPATDVRSWRGPKHTVVFAEFQTRPVILHLELQARP